MPTWSFLLNEPAGDRCYDIARGQVATVNSLAQTPVSIGQNGLYRFFNDGLAGNYITLPAGTDAVLNGSFTVSLLINVDLTVGPQNNIFGNRESPQARCLAGATGGATNLTTIDEAVAFIQSPTYSPDRDNLDTHVVWTYKVGGNSTVYWQGTQQSQTAYTFSGSFTGSYFLSDDKTGSALMLGKMYFAHLWPREFSASEVLQHTALPYLHLRPLIRRRYFVPAGGATTPQSVADTLSLSEAITRRTGKALADALSLTEALHPQTRKTILETVALSEQLAKFVSHPLAETLSLSENLGRLRLRLQGVSDTLSLTEQLRLVVKTGLSETVALAENLARQTKKRLTETVSLTENLSAIKVVLKPLGDTLTLTENLRRVVGTTPDDTLGLSETVTRLVRRATADTVGLSEDDTHQVTRILTELASFTENLVVKVIEQVQLSDTVSLTETQRRQIGKTVQDVLGLTETRMVQIARRFQESVLLDEAFQALFIPSGGFVQLIQVLGEAGAVPTALLEEFAGSGVTLETFGASS